MDKTPIIIIAILGVISIAAFLLFRSGVKIEFGGPLGVKFKIDASNVTSKSVGRVVIEDATSRRGGVRAEDKTGGGASLKKIKAEKDIVASSSPAEKISDPKA
jgi:hypothetical protein